jgi:pyruvate/2-oxoglutarate dehydrogenase complex dihydrolipoamide dehydrogenase (E3) component
LAFLNSWLRIDKYPQRRLEFDLGPAVDAGCRRWRHRGASRLDLRRVRIANPVIEAGPRVLATEDESVSAAAAAAFCESGMVVQENFGTIESFDKAATGVRMNYSKDGQRFSAEATLAVVAVGWMADTAGLNLAEAGVALDERKFIKVVEYLRTSAPHIFAAGDIIGRMMLVPQAIQGGFVAATNAMRGPTLPLLVVDEVAPTAASRT